MNEIKVRMANRKAFSFSIGVPRAVANTLLVTISIMGIGERTETMKNVEI